MKIAYIDMAFHKLTKSNEFLSDVISNLGHEVTRYWDHSFDFDGLGGKPFDLQEAKNHDALVLFQVLGNFRGKLRNSHENITFIPMLDGYSLGIEIACDTSDYWKIFRGVKILNFSKALHHAALSHGVVSRYFQYYQKPLDDLPTPKEGLHGFFWCRRPGSISFDVVRKLIGETKFDSLHIHMAPDPVEGEPEPEMPTDEEIARHNITISNWFEKKSDFEKTLTKANVFFAPRLSEGIGQSMLEAFARAQCVVSPDYGTMNEYINDGENGLLYDFGDIIKPLRFERAVEMGLRGWERAKRGFNSWENSKADIVEFILTKPSVYYDDPKIFGGYALAPMTILSRIASSSAIKPLRGLLRPLWKRYCRWRSRA